MIYHYTIWSAVALHSDWGLSHASCRQSLCQYKQCLSSNLLKICSTTLKYNKILTYTPEHQWFNLNACLIKL